MTGYVVDASIAVKWVVTEQYSDEAASLLESDQRIVAPDLLFAEAANALWALARRGDIKINDVADALAVLIDAQIDTPYSMRQLTAAAARLAIDIDHPVYDCFYLALAVREQCPVITADNRFHNKVAGHPYLSNQVVHISDIS